MKDSPDIRDNRDPEDIWKVMESEMGRHPDDKPSTLADNLPDHRIRNYRDQLPPIDRYGDPRKRHEQRLADGTEPVLNK